MKIATRPPAEPEHTERPACLSDPLPPGAHLQPPADPPPPRPLKLPKHRQISLTIYPWTRRKLKQLAERVGCSRPELLAGWARQEAVDGISLRSHPQILPAKARDQRKVHAPITVGVRAADRIDALAEELECSRSELIERWVRYEASRAGLV